MEPKDLKNSEELKFAKEEDINKLEVNIESPLNGRDKKSSDQKSTEDTPEVKDGTDKSAEDKLNVRSVKKDKGVEEIPKEKVREKDSVGDDNNEPDSKDKNETEVDNNEIINQDGGEKDSDDSKKTTHESPGSDTKTAAAKEDKSDTAEKEDSTKSEEKIETDTKSEEVSENDAKEAKAKPGELKDDSARAEDSSSSEAMEKSVEQKEEKEKDVSGEKANMGEPEVEDSEEKVNAGKEEDSKKQKVKSEKSEEKKKIKSSETSAVKVTIPKKHSKSESENKQAEITDYTTYNQVELVNAMRDLLDHDGERDVKNEVEAIKSAFYKELKEEQEIQKKQFIEDGGNEEDFLATENPYEKDIKDLLKKYRQLRIEFNKRLEQEKELNLQLKYEVIDEIKGLIHKEESINKTFQDFRELQKHWREIGLVPQSKVKDLWDTYHFHVENFYDYIKINQELRDLDLKKNLEMKIRLCEQAEELILEPNIVKAFHALQKLHERWREIGPVPRENKDDIWDRFKASTTKINKKHQEYFEHRKSEQKKNLEAKIALCEQVEEINELELSTHKDWNEKSKEVISIQKVWRTIGFAPRKDNNKIYSRFRSTCDKFFDAKREFYAQNKELQQNNLQLKIDLCVQAEGLKDSNDWRKTTIDLINIQKQWKEIGPVPRKQSDSLWKRFRAACDFFFDKKAEHFSNIDEEQVENLTKKEKLIEDIINFKSSESVDDNLSMMKEFQRRWTEIGHVPIKQKDVIQKNFRDAINKLFDDLNVDEPERNLLKFKTKIATVSESSRGQDILRVEREKYMTRLKQHENDLILLDNNIGFFAKSKKTESLIEDVKRKIEQTKEKIEFLKEKIRVIDEMDQSDE